MEIKNKNLVNLFYQIFPEKIMHNHTYCLKRFVRYIAKKHDKKGKKLIDIGAGNCPYQNYFSKLKYTSQDIKQNKVKIDIISSAVSIPVKNKSFDYILCIQVLEHLKEPHLVFKEFYRILKKGGSLFLTTHMAFEEHMQPNDYYRFTRYGLKHLAKTSGFKVKKIKAQGGRFIVLAREIQVLGLRIIKNKWIVILFYLIFLIPIFLLSLILYLLDYLDKDKSLSLNYECVFIK